MQIEIVYVGIIIIIFFACNFVEKLISSGIFWINAYGGLRTDSNILSFQYFFSAFASENVHFYHSEMTKLWKSDEEITVQFHTNNEHEKRLCSNAWIYTFFFSTVQNGAICFRSSESGEVIWKRKMGQIFHWGKRNIFYMHLVFNCERDNTERKFFLWNTLYIYFIAVTTRVSNHNRHRSNWKWKRTKSKSVPNKIMTIDFRFSLPVQNEYTRCFFSSLCLIRLWLGLSHTSYADNSSVLDVKINASISGAKWKRNVY